MPLVAVISREIGVLWAMPCIWGTELILLLPFGLFPSWPKNNHEWWVAGRVSIFESIGFLSVTYGTFFAPVSLIAPVSSLSVLFTIGLGLFLLKERLSKDVLFGILVACAGIFFINL